MSTELWNLPVINAVQFFYLKNIVNSVIHIILFVIKNEEYLSSSNFNFDCQLFNTSKQYSVEEKMKVILSTIIPI